MFYQLVGIANASFYDSLIRSSNQSSLEPTYDKTQVDIRLFNILYCTSKRKTPPNVTFPLRNSRSVNQGLLRPYFLGEGGIGGVPLDSHEFLVRNKFSKNVFGSFWVEGVVGRYKL